MILLKAVRMFFCSMLMVCTFPVFSAPDVTFVSFLLPEDGLGKVPITILEALGDEINSNVRVSHHSAIHQINQEHVLAALNNPDLSPGKVCLMTDTLGMPNRQPSDLVPHESIVKLAYSMLESTKIPTRWVTTLNEKFDAVIVPDQFLVSVYQDSGVNIPVFVLPIPMLLDAYFEHPIHADVPSDPFTFYDASANKNPGILVEAFAAAFGNHPHVRLLMRAGNLFPENRHAINRLIDQFQLRNVIIEGGFLNFPQYLDKLASVDCYINLSRGEGFSLIPREALALGIPVIITDNTASSTICNTGFVRAVPSNKRGPANDFYRMIFHERCGEQFDCDVNDAATALLDVYENYSKYIEAARQGRIWVNQYNSTNPDLQALYRTLVKPSKVILGNENTINKYEIITDSIELYEKYQEVINSNKLF